MGFFPFPVKGFVLFFFWWSFSILSQQGCNPQPVYSVTFFQPLQSMYFAVCAFHLSKHFADRLLTFILELIFIATQNIYNLMLPLNVKLTYFPFMLAYCLPLCCCCWLFFFTIFIYLFIFCILLYTVIFR